MYIFSCLFAACSLLRQIVLMSSLLDDNNCPDDEHDDMTLVFCLCVES